MTSSRDFGAFLSHLCPSLGMYNLAQTVHCSSVYEVSFPFISLAVLSSNSTLIIPSHLLKPSRTVQNLILPAERTRSAHFRFDLP